MSIHIFSLGYFFKIIKQFFRPGGATSSGTTSSGGSENTLYNITGKIGLKNLNS